MSRRHALLIWTSGVGWLGVRQTLQRLLSEERVAEAGDAGEALHLTEKYAPSLVIAPAELHGEPTLALLADLRHQDTPWSRFVIISWRLDDLDQFQDFVTLGVAGYFLWEELNSTTLPLWLESIIRGAMVFGPGAEIVRQSMERSRLCLLGDAPMLNSRETEILQMLATGAKRSEIQAVLNISEKTFYRNIESMKAHLGARTRDELLVKATLLSLVA